MTYARTIRFAARRIIIVQLAALTAAAVLLLAQWASAAVYEETCHRQPLLQSARPGETVLVCELTRVASHVEATSSHVEATSSHVEATSPRLARHTAKRVGSTTVTHYGLR